ncbi:MAG: ABC transporter permease [Anaerolineae bacterium]|nr:ABC transporter permease [Anaerolineae bacterium]
MLRLAMRNLFQNRVRFLISTGGAALALLLILTLNAIVTGLESQITAYIDYSGADIIVSQRDVRNLHMATSTLPVNVVDKIRSVPGVEAVTPILYATNTVRIGTDPIVTYVIGIPQEATMGLPWRVTQGQSIPANGQAVVDYALAVRAGLTSGDTVETMGQQFTIVGLSEGTANFMNTITIISLDDFARIRRTTDSVSYVLVKVQPGAILTDVFTRIEQAVPNATVQLRQAFAAEERRLVKDMSSDIINIINIIGFVIGLAMIALTTYMATLSRKTEYGMLKALGMGNRYLYRVVLAQGVISVVSGLALGLIFTLILAAIVPKIAPNLILEIDGASLLRLGGLSLLIAGLASILPIRQIIGLEPAVIVRGGK